MEREPEFRARVAGAFPDLPRERHRWWRSFFIPLRRLPGRADCAQRARQLAVPGMVLPGLAAAYWALTDAEYGRRLRQRPTARARVYRRGPAPHCAVRSGDLRALRALLAADPSAALCRDAFDNTPLHCACALGRADAVEALLARCPCPDPPNDRGETPLHVASARGDAAAVRRLLAAGASVYLADCGGATALHCAARSGSAAIMRALLAAGALLEARDAGLATPLHLACGSGCTEAVSMLLEAGAVADAESSNGSTPLFLAAHASSVGATRLLLAAGARPGGGRRGDDACTPLHEACTQGAAMVAEALLAAGADPSCRNQRGGTPLHAAAAAGCAEAVELLLAAGGDPNARDGDGATPLHLAVGAGAGEGQAAVQVLRLLIRAGARLEARQKGCTALMLAGQLQSKASLRELLELGADPDARDLQGRSLLHFTMQHGGDTSVLRDVAAAGANLFPRDCSGALPETLSAPLPGARIQSHGRMLRALVKARLALESFHDDFFNMPRLAVASVPADASVTDDASASVLEDPTQTTYPL